MMNFLAKTSNFFLFDAVTIQRKVYLRILNENSATEKALENQNSDTEKFSEIFNKYFDKVYQFFYFRLRNASDAEDLAAETFEKVLKNFHSFEERGHGMAAWIFKIARNALSDFFRKKKFQIDSIDELEPSREPSKDFSLKDLDRDMLKEKLWEVVETLPERQKAVWGLKLSSDLPHKEIGKILGVSEANVNVIVHRSLTTLKQQLGHLYYE